ncbi:MAG: tetratricopeptide repeat protein [Planctomycetota bacterium]
MFRLTKEKIIVIIAVIFLGLILWMLVFKKGGTLEEWVLSQKPRTYYAIPPKESISSSAQVNPVRNPFVSQTQKAEYVIDLSLPDPIRKQFTLVGFKPFPDSRCGDKGTLRIQTGKSYSYDNSIKLASPSSGSLPATETLQTLIIETNQNLNPSPDKVTPTPETPIDDDVLTLQNGLEIRGKYIGEDNDNVWFVPAGRNAVVTYKRRDISNIKRTSYTTDELYEIELKKVSVDDAYSWWRLSEWCFEKGLEDKAVAALQKAVKINDHELKFYLKLSDYYRKKKDFDNEFALYQKALQSTLINKETIYFKLGEAYEILGLFKEALDSYEKAVGINSNYVEALLNSANLYCLTRNYDSALKIYERLRDLSPTEVKVFEGLGLLEYQRGNLAKAREILLKIAERSGISADTLNILGMLFVLDADYSNAGQYFIKSISNNPDCTPAWNNLGFLYLSANLYPQAEMLFNEYSSLNPADEVSLIGLGYLKWLNNKTDEALTLFNSALKMMPDSFVAHYVRGQLYFNQQDYQNAQQDFAWCLSTVPSFTETLYYLAMVSLYQKDYKQAIQYYKAYLNQMPPNLMSGVDDFNSSIALVGNGDIGQARKILTEDNHLKNYVPSLNLLAYIDYNEHNVEQAIKRLEESMSIDKSIANAYARDSLDKIRRAFNQTIWSDNFDRVDSNVLGGGWAETEKYGVEIAIVNKQCLFKGSQSLNATGLATIEKTVSKSTFIKWEVRLKIDLTSDAIAGIYFSNSAKDNTLFIARNKQQFVYGSSNKPDAPPAEWLPFQKQVTPAEDFKITLEPVVSKGRLAEFRCFIDDVLCGTIQVKSNSFSNSKDTTYLIGIFGYAPLNKQWELAVKNVKIFEEKIR